MRPDATSPSPSPFSAIPEAEWLCANDLAFAIFDRFPVSPGHVLVITRRVVPTYFDCTAAEQRAVMDLVGEVKRLLDERLDPKPDGYNVGFNAGAAAGQTVPHVHVHVIPRYSGDMPDPRGGVRHVIPEKGNYLAGPAASPRLSLTTGPDRPLWPRLADRLPGASEIDLLASFVQTSGLDHVREGLFSAITAGAKIRLLVGDYLVLTQHLAGLGLENRDERAGRHASLVFPALFIAECACRRLAGQQLHAAIGISRGSQLNDFLRHLRRHAVAEWIEEVGESRVHGCHGECSGTGCCRCLRPMPGSVPPFTSGVNASATP